MRKFLRRIRYFFSQKPDDVVDLLERPRARKHWCKYRQGSTAEVLVPVDGKSLSIALMRPIEADDVQDGKLLSASWLRVKRRGGKRITGLHLSFESAEALHVALTQALNDARRKQAFDLHMQRILVTVFAFCEEQQKAR